MNILITGGFGHLGSELLSKAIHKSYIKNIIVVDNFLTERFCSYLKIKNKKKLIIFDNDINNFNFNNIKIKINFVIHLAAITNAEKSFGNEKEILKNNLLGTKRITNYCVKNKIPLIFASSTSVYGDQSKIINSSNNKEKKIINPQSPYAKCKILEENYIKKNLRKYLILRLGTICGVSEGMRFHTAINKFSYQVSLNKPITIWRKLYKKKRPYLVLSDFVNLIFFLLKKDDIIGIFDVVSENCSVTEIVKKIKKFKKKISIKFVNTKILNQKSYVVIPDEIKRKGFRFKGKIENEIKKTLKILN
tara:strand:+ start:877 stop:1791 length:915 start_codon:yes stop_codon:yes gene_type:complete